MIATQECAICRNTYNLMREHCPTCGARRVFHANHSFEPTCVTVHAIDSETRREIVRAYRSDFAFAHAR